MTYRKRPGPESNPGPCSKASAHIVCAPVEPSRPSYLTRSMSDFYRTGTNVFCLVFVLQYQALQFGVCRLCERVACTTGAILWFK